MSKSQKKQRHAGLMVGAKQQQPTKIDQTRNPNDLPDEQEHFQSLLHAHDAMMRSYEGYGEVIESLNSRAGVALTGLLTALAFFSFRIDVSSLETKYKWMVFIFYGLNLVLVFIASSYLKQAMQPQKIITPYSSMDLLKDELHAKPNDFFHQQMSNLNAAIESRKVLMDYKSSNLENGTNFVILAVVTHLCIQFGVSIVAAIKTQ